MKSVNIRNHLGLPSIEIEGFRLWIQSRQFPDLDDYWDGNWLNITAQCRAKEAEVWISGPLVWLPEIASWATACERMQRSLAGEAQLDCLEPGLNVKLTAESLGHISMTVEITPDHLNQEHTFRFEIDQSYLTSLISTLRSILREFPIKGVNDG